MKKLLIIAALLLMGSGAFAQTNSLTIDNTKNPCGVNVVMHAVATGFPLCSLESNPYFVAPYGIMVWPTYSPFQIVPGWTSGVTVPAGDPNFVWTDADFQFVNCPDTAGCSDGGSHFINNFQHCEPAAGVTNPWTDPYCTGTPITATFSPVFGPYGANFLITFFW